MKKYTYHQDAGHGWLEVTHKDICKLGLQDKISQCSYIDNTRVFLEEDLDMRIFLEALLNKTNLIYDDFKNIIKENHVNRSRIRNKYCYDQRLLNPVKTPIYKPIYLSWCTSYEHECNEFKKLIEQCPDDVELLKEEYNFLLTQK